MRWWLAGFAILLCQAQEQISPDLALLVKIKAKVVENLKRLPNYTCTETIERRLKRKPSDTPSVLDTVRLEIAYVEGKELFGISGSGHIDQAEIGKLVGGTIGNGDFALLLKEIFQGQSPTFRYKGDVKLDGKSAVCFDYRVGTLQSGYRLSTPSAEAVVGHHGSFWVDPETLDLIQIEQHADDLPASLGIASASEMLEYGPVHIGSGTFLLPRAAELILIESTGIEHGNRTKFQACHQFVGESVLSFAEMSPTAAENPVDQQHVTHSTLPDDFTVELNLETPIDSSSSAVGDSITASLRQGINLGRTIAVPKGASLTGHIARLDKQGGVYTLDLALTSLDFKGGHADLSARTNALFMIVTNRTQAVPSADGRQIEATTETQATLVFRTGRVKLQRGSHLVLRSRVAGSKDPTAAQEPGDSTSLLARIKTAVTENLARLPNYTCTEIIQRSTKRQHTSKTNMMETSRLEVAFVEGKELFGWPGAAKIDEPEIGKLVGGPSSNGYFALFSRIIFTTPSATFRYMGPEQLDGDQVIRYDYRVPQTSQTYRLATELGEVSVGFHGSFWVNSTSLDLTRITVTVDNPPVVLGITSTTSVLDFARTKIGNATFVLPHDADLMMVESGGAEGRQQLSFQACHEFRSESVLKFDEPSPEPAEASAKPAPAVVTLPDDFTVDFILDTPIDAATAAGGDPVRAALRSGIVANGRVLVPSGARLSGRIAHLAMRDGLYYLEFNLSSLDFDGGHANLAGRRNGVSVKNLPLIYTSARFKLARGARLTLHSRLLKSEEHDSIRP